MSKKAFLPLRMAPLQRVIAEPITDPAERAALDKLRKRQRRKPGGQKKVNRKDRRAASTSATKRRG